MDKSDYIDVFNKMIKGIPVPFNEALLPMISEFLTENNREESNKMINLVVQNPNLAQRFIPQLEEYFCKKYNIYKIIFKNKTILYYE